MACGVRNERKIAASMAAARAGHVGTDRLNFSAAQNLFQRRMALVSRRMALGALAVAAAGGLTYVLLSRVCSSPHGRPRRPLSCSVTRRAV